MKSAFLDKLIQKMDRVDRDSLQTQFLRLAQEKGWMETVFHAIQEGIVVLERPGKIAYANRAAEKLLGIKLDQAIGQPLADYIREVEWERLTAFEEEEWQKLSRRELEIGYPEHRFVEFYVVPLEHVNPDEQGAVVLFRDITNDREREASTLESERLNAVMLLAAGVAHEIGNPLNSLNIHLQLLEREIDNMPKENADEVRELVSVARGEIGRLDQILNQFLGAIRPTDPVLQPEDLREVLEETLKVLRGEVEDRGIWLEVDAPDSLPSIQVDKAQMKQAFFNIIRNAMQAMSESGVIKIVMRASESVVTVSFEDNGSGIDPEDLSHIFEAYHTTRKKGTGLGLMIVQRILREHGGHLDIESQPGLGSTFTIVLPRKDRRIRLIKSFKNGAADA